MDAETRLAALWVEAGPPAHDPMFALAVMERIERRHLWRRAATELVPLVAVLAVAGWALAPAMTDLATAVIAAAADVSTVGLATALCVMLGVWLAFGLREQPA
jgi:hypothetical protein